MNLNCAKFIKKTGYNSDYYTPFSKIYSPTYFEIKENTNQGDAKLVIV